MKIYSYNLWYGEYEILNVGNVETKWFKKPSFNVEGKVIFMSNINSLYYADEVNYISYKSFKKLSVEEIEIIRKEML